MTRELNLLARGEGPDGCLIDVRAYRKGGALIVIKADIVPDSTPATRERVEARPNSPDEAAQWWQDVVDTYDLNVIYDTGSINRTPDRSVVT